MNLVSEPYFKTNTLGKKYKVAEYRCSYCETISEKRTADVLSGKTTSCGCFRKSNASKLSKTHGLTSSREYKAWSNMINRCYNSKCLNYSNYGGRGITVCDRWVIAKGGSFENFIEDLGRCPDNLTLDRIDFDGNYSPENCRWVNLNVQAFNKRTIDRDLPLGIYSSGDSYRVYIGVEGRQLYLGSRSELEAAIGLRKEAEIKYYGDFLQRKPDQRFDIVRDLLTKMGIEL